MLAKREVTQHDGIEGPCWYYQGKAGNSYSTEDFDEHKKIRDDNQRLNYVHRVSYEHHHGPIPEGLLVRHICHHRSCFAPHHLLVGTNSDNMKDMIAAGRGPQQLYKAHVCLSEKLDDCPF